MTEPKNQHIIPQCYLKQFIDPDTPKGHEPYVWIFERGSKIGRNKAPKNILAATDFYTLKTEFGGKDYTIEKSLSQIESDYAILFETKIKKKLPLDPFEHIILCSFVAAMWQRTLKQKKNVESMLDQVIDMVTKMEKAHGMPPKKSLELKEDRENFTKISLIKMIPHITKILLRMNVAFLYGGKAGSFITSDAPCFLFNSQLQWQHFYGPGLMQRNVEVRMPLSPEIAVCFSWVNNLRGYLQIDADLIHESNRMVFGHSHEHFIANSKKIKRGWFRRFPLDPIFILKIFKNRTWPELKNCLIEKLR